MSVHPPSVPPKYWWIPLIIAGLSFALSGYAEYNRSDKDVSNRLTALETQRDSQQRQLDHIQSQVDKLVDWALGK